MNSCSPIIFLVLVISDAGGPDAMEVDEVLRQIGQDWERRRAAADRVEYVLEGEGLIPKGSWTELIAGVGGKSPSGEVPPADYRYPLKKTLLIDFERNKLRKETQMHRYNGALGGFAPTFFIYLFDGSESQFFTPRDKNRHDPYARAEFASELMEDGTLPGLMLETGDRPILFAHGIVAPTRAPNQLRVPVDSELFAVHGTAMLEGRQQVALRSGPIGKAQDKVIEVWVDLERDSAVTRYAWLHADGTEGDRVEVSYQRTKAGWIPDRWTAYYTHALGLCDVHAVRVVRFRLNLDLEDRAFHIEPPAGMIVYDAERELKYRKGRPGEPDIPVGQLIAQRRRERAQIWLWLGLAVVLLSVAWVITRRFIRTSRPS